MPSRSCSALTIAFVALTVAVSIPAAAFAAPATLVVDPVHRVYRPVGSTVNYVEGIVWNEGADSVTDPRVTMKVDYLQTYVPDLTFDVPVAAHVIAPGESATFSGPAQFNSLPQYTLVFGATGTTTTAESVWLYGTDPAGPATDSAWARHWTGTVTNDSGSVVSGLITSGVEWGSALGGEIYGTAVDSTKIGSLVPANGQTAYDLRGLNKTGTPVSGFWDGGTPAMEVWGAEAVAWDPMPVWRFYNVRTGSHFFTADPGERTALQTGAAATYRLEGEAYQVNRADPTNCRMLYRFFNKRTGTHFYTVDPAERDAVINTLGAIYQYDGPAYRVSTHPYYTRPVDRFYNLKTGSHLFSADPAEIQSIRTNLSKTYRWEGTAFYLGY